MTTRDRLIRHIDSLLRSETFPLELSRGEWEYVLSALKERTASPAAASASDALIDRIIEEYFAKGYEDQEEAENELRRVLAKSLLAPAQSAARIAELNRQLADMDWLVEQMGIDLVGTGSSPPRAVYRRAAKIEEEFHQRIEERNTALASPPAGREPR